MARTQGLADMPQEVLTMILRELFTGTVIKKIKFTERRVQNSQSFSRNWLPIMLANKTISHIAKDIFSQEAIVEMKATQLVTTKARGVGAELRCGEKELQYFEQAEGDMDFLYYLLYYTSADQQKKRGSGLRCTMFSKLKSVYLSHGTVYVGNQYEFRAICNLMNQYKRREIRFVAHLSAYSAVFGAYMHLVLKSNEPIELRPIGSISKERSNELRVIITQQLNSVLSST